MKCNRTMIAALLVITLLLVSHAIAQVCVTPPTGMMSWWPGDGDAGDIQGGHDGTFNGAFVGGKVGLAFDLNGSSDFVQVPDSAAWDFGQDDFTIDLWVNFNQVNDPQTFVAHDEGPNNTNKWIFWLRGGQLEFHINDPVNGPTFLGVPFSPAPNTWYHVAVTRSGIIYTFYINGAAAGSLANITPVPNASAHLTLGWAEGTGTFLDGLLDEVEIFNSALLLQTSRPSTPQAAPANANSATRMVTVCPMTTTTALMWRTPDRKMWMMTG